MFELHSKSQTQNFRRGVQTPMSNGLSNGGCSIRCIKDFFRVVALYLSLRGDVEEKCEDGL